MATDYSKSLSRMSIEMNEDTATKDVGNDNDERIIVSALEESKIRKAVSFALRLSPQSEAQANICFITVRSTSSTHCVHCLCALLSRPR